MIETINGKAYVKKGDKVYEVSGGGGSGGELPEVTEAENGSFTQVVEGKVVYTPPNYILGTGGTYTLYAASWVDGVLIGGFDLKERDAIFFTPATREDKTAMENAGIFISTSDTNWQVVTFEAATTPTADITLKYFIVRGW